MTLRQDTVKAFSIVIDVKIPFDKLSRYGGNVTVVLYKSSVNHHHLVLLNYLIITQFAFAFGINISNFHVHLI